jgi:hypothetical protein
MFRQYMLACFPKYAGMYHLYMLYGFTGTCLHVFLSASGANCGGTGQGAVAKSQRER